MNNIQIWLAPTLGFFRLLMSYKVITLTSPIAIAFVSNLYVFAGLYALGHALSQLKQLSPKAQKFSTTLHMGVAALFVSRGVADLCRYLDLYDKFRILPTLLIQPLTGYPPVVELIASHLPFFSLAIIIAFTLHQLYSAPLVKNTDLKAKVISGLNILFIAVATAMCLTHAYILFGLLFSQSYYAAVVTPYSATHISHLLSKVYDPLASATLIMPTVLGVTPPTSKMQNQAEPENTVTI